MNTLFFSARKFEQPYLFKANEGKHQIKLIEESLSENTYILAEGMEAVSLFSGDDASAKILDLLNSIGIKYIATRSAGFNHIDLAKAEQLGIQVARVPSYSPCAIAEHTVTLMLALNRKIIQANQRVKQLNFSLNGLVGFDMHNKTVGVIGTGEIGSKLVKILHGFGCKILAFDLYENPELIQDYGVKYLSLEELISRSDIITLHVPLNPSTHYIINEERIQKMKKGVMLINTGRGKLLDTKAVIDALKTGKVAYLGLDVYEEEEGLFFEDHSDDLLLDDTIARLMTFKNVLITSHQAFLTDTALINIAETTISNLTDFGNKTSNDNLINLKETVSR